MVKKISSLALLMMLGTFLFFAPFVQAFQISDLKLSCTDSTGLECAVISDVSSGDCRTSIFSSQNEEAKIMTCIKGDTIEVYRQSFSEKIKEACYSNVCVDSMKGFEKKLISELNIDIIDIIDEVITLPQTDPVQEEENPTVPTQPNSNFAIDPNSISSLGISYAQIIEEWNKDTWNDVVDESFSTNSNLAAVRWYNTEGQCTGNKCQDQLHNGNGACNDLNVADSKFCGVTDEFSNVLLNHAMGSNQERYNKLHRFAEKLRRPEINDLQCWKYYITGDKEYNDYNDVCVSKDSASDASIRILGAYGLACSKQLSGEWSVTDIDYCGDYERQGRAVWGYGTDDHGEVKKLSNGDYFLCNGYNNQVNCPSASQSFRPDYYELQFMMDFAVYMDSNELKQGVLDMLDYYISNAEIGGNMIHIGKTGSQNLNAGGTYVCTDLCTPAYMDNIDTWRAIPAISGLYNLYGESLNNKQKSLFDYWWNNYVKVNDANSNKPFEIFSYSTQGKIKSSENSYKTLSMWIPLASSKDSTYTKQSVDKLISMYNGNEKQFSGSAYYGGYFSQFAQRAIGSSTGMISPSFWNEDAVVVIPTPEEEEPNPTPEENETVTPNPEENNSPRTGSGSGSGSGGSGSTQNPQEEETTIVKTSHNNIKNIPVTCDGGTIIHDEYFGGRRIECVSNSGAKLTVEAWDKHNSVNPQYFEMYKKAHIGSGLEICIANTCISNSGFARSSNYPIVIESEEIVEEEPNIPKNPVEETQSEIYHLKKDGLYIEYVCKPVGSSEKLVVDWNFGNGKQIYDVGNKISHQYDSKGNYYVQCGVWDNELGKFTALAQHFEI